LLLPIAGQTLIARVVSALREGGADRVVVVAPPEVSFEGPAIAREARGAGAFVVAPGERPAEMRDSIEIGLATVAKPAPPDHVLLSPGDAPGITPRVVALLIEESARQPEKIVVPRCGARRGHPLLLPWNLAAGVASLPPGQGLNALVARNQGLVEEVTVSDARVADDIDSIEDYGRWEKPPGGLSAGDRVRVMFFALARERAGCSDIDVEIARGCRVSDIRAQVARLLPDLAPLMKTVMIAVNEEYADDEMQVFPGARIAVIPPVSGGAVELTGGSHHS
jgi:molybdopterin converting factor subunit 1